VITYAFYDHHGLYNSIARMVVSDLAFSVVVGCGFILTVCSTIRYRSLLHNMTCINALRCWIGLALFSHILLLRAASSIVGEYHCVASSRRIDAWRRYRHTTTAATYRATVTPRLRTTTRCTFAPPFENYTHARATLVAHTTKNTRAHAHTAATHTTHATHTHTHCTRAHATFCTHPGGWFTHPLPRRLRCQFWFTRFYTTPHTFHLPLTFGSIPAITPPRDYITGLAGCYLHYGSHTLPPLQLRLPRLLPPLLVTTPVAVHGPLYGCQFVYPPSSTVPKRFPLGSTLAHTHRPTHHAHTAHLATHTCFTVRFGLLPVTVYTRLLLPGLHFTAMPHCPGYPGLPALPFTGSVTPLHYPVYVSWLLLPLPRCHFYTFVFGPVHFVVTFTATFTTLHGWFLPAPHTHHTPFCLWVTHTVGWITPHGRSVG